MDVVAVAVAAAVVVVEIMIVVIDHEGKNCCGIVRRKSLSYFSRDRRQRSGSPPSRGRRAGSRSRSPRSRSPAPRR